MGTQAVASGGAGTSLSAPLLQLSSVSKTFGATKVLGNVSLEVHSGEIVALVGHNGSGKSTLVKILAGVHRADPGAQMEIVGSEGQRVDVMQAQDRLHFIHQDLGLVDMLTTTENLDLGQSHRAGGLLPTKQGAMHEAAQRVVARFGSSFDVRVPVRELSPADRTVVAMARALSGWSGSDHLLVLDEPTTAFHADEVARLFAAVRTVVSRGAGVIFISHRLSEVFEFTDRAVVLRDGRLVGAIGREAFDHDHFIEMIAGRALAPALSKQPEHGNIGDAALKVDGLRGDRVEGLNFAVRAGEILGVAGVAGSGREQLAGLIFGARERLGGSVHIEGRPVPSDDIGSAIQRGVGFVPAERHRDGAIMTLCARENLTLPLLRPLRRTFGRLDARAEKADVAGWIETVGLRPPAPEQPLSAFSGGNQQKVVLAKWLRTKPHVLLLDEPTQGVDVGAKAAIYELIEEAARSGTAVLVASSDTEELVRLCDRVLVLDGGQMAAEIFRADLSEPRLLSEVQRSHITEPDAHTAPETHDV